jgi:cytoplasmic iron level regulating protein YaaA (DUF328/UPF0246 family)
MKVLLSPAKSLDYNTKIDYFDFSIPTYLKESEILAKKMSKNSASKIATMMTLSKNLAELNHHRYQNWEAPSDSNDSNRQCIFAFSGEVYKGFDAWSLSESQLNLAQDKIRIISGLYGILKPLDLIYPYRLEMGTKWEITPKIKNLYSFWGSKIIDFLSAEMKINDESEIINLASNEYFKALDLKKNKYKIITPIFKDLKNGEYKMIMMYAKHARGAMARYIITNKINSSEELKLYSNDGYQFDVNQSNEKEFVFVR